MNDYTAPKLTPADSLVAGIGDATRKLKIVDETYVLAMLDGSEIPESAQFAILRIDQDPGLAAGIRYGLRTYLAKVDDSESDAVKALLRHLDTLLDGQ